MSSVTIKNVRKNYGNLEVVHGINLTIEDGSFVVLLGPSGCGKSTLLRMIAGLESVTGGDVEIQGRRVNDVHPKDRNIAMVFQNYALYAHMKVRDNMSFSLQLAKRPKAEVDEKVGWAAKILNLEPYLDRYPRELSGGQRQRVAMGRAIVREPAVFLFDEPLSNLDAKLRVQMRAELQALHRRLATTSLYVTHDQVEAMTMAQRMIVMNAGRAEQIGAPLDVYAKPATTFVAGFIGSPPMNLIPAQRNGQDILLGIRPEHLDPCAPSEAMLTVDVDLLEPLGSDTLVYGRLSGNSSDVRVAVRLHQSFAAHTGKLALRYDRAQEHYFDAASGLRIEP